MTMRNKFGAKKAKREYKGEKYEFPSRAEAAFFDKLISEYRGGRINGFTVQPSFTISTGYTIATDKTKSGKSKVPGMKYTADFRVMENDGRVTIIEVKGKITTDYTMRKKLFLRDAWIEFGVSNFVEVIGSKEFRYNCESVLEI